jgi:AbrB family looped-hinge helix DNA binding protein
MNQTVCYATIRNRGQITIPEGAREFLDLESGDELKLTVRKIPSE